MGFGLGGVPESGDPHQRLHRQLIGEAVPRVVGLDVVLDFMGVQRQTGHPAVRAAMLRSALALVGTPQDWRDVAERLELFDEG
ncbi:threonine dehydrogenase-like Zn-dependent dehydrogenase [Mycobacteroides chelonae]|nr:threonine dehydrogenase-like Zn-dependent dehydrogenase [Mycobacteroides chelonae]